MELTPWRGSPPGGIDVWAESLQAAKTLRQCATPQCRILASSRSPDVAAELASSQRQVRQLEVLDPVPALTMLREHASNEVDADEAGAVAIAEALGRLPLALKLAARLLQQDDHADRCARLLATWQQRMTDLAGYEVRPGFETERLSLDAIVGLSYDALPDDATRSAACDLAVFGARPLDWDAAAMKAVWAVDEPTANRWKEALVASGLLERHATTRRYSLHQTVHAFLAQREPDPAAFQRHATYYADLMELCDAAIEHEATIDATLAILDGEIGQIERGQQAAAAGVSMRDSVVWHELTLRYAFACFSYLSLRGRYQQLLDWLKPALKLAQQQADNHAVAELLRRLGIVYAHQGQYARAREHYHRSLNLYKQIEDKQGMAAALGDLGNVYHEQGQYDQAREYYHRSLELSERIGMATGQSHLMGSVGKVASIVSRPA